MQKLSDHPAPARLGRFFRMLVGEGQPAEQSDDLVDLTDGPPDLARIELRLQRLERGVRAMADGMRQSHEQLREAIRSMEAELRERDRVTRSEIQRMLWQALGPVAASIQQLSESLGSLPPAIAEGDRLAAGADSDWSLTAEPSEPEAPADSSQLHPTEELKDLPARPFDLEH
jgi:hypothetical protein